MEEELKKINQHLESISWQLKCLNVNIEHLGFPVDEIIEETMCPTEPESLDKEGIDRLREILKKQDVTPSAEAILQIINFYKGKNSEGE